MKPRFAILVTLTSVSLWFSINLQAGVPGATVVERGPHHALHHWTVEQLWPDGQNITEDHYVTELASGLNYLKDGQWIESKEEIELFQGGAVARQGQFQVIFAPNLNEVGAVDLVVQN